MRQLSRIQFMLLIACNLSFGVHFGTVDGKDETELGRRTSWTIPTREQVFGQIENWLREVSATEEIRSQALALWKGSTPTGRADELDRTISVIALVDPTARQLIVQCHSEHSATSRKDLPTFPDAAHSWVRGNLRLYYGRWLVQNELYDEAIAEIGDIPLQDVVDPAALLFYQSVCYHQLLEKQKFVAVAQKLLENKERLPQRFLTIAKLMEADLERIEVDSLDEIQRLMSDVRRRLFLGRAGKRVRDQEDDVIAKLDKLIKKAEEAQQNQQQQSGMGSSQMRPTAPLEQSGLPVGGAAGRVDPKKLGNSSGWGNLPPKQRQEALQRISRELPAHYREVIEEYFRKLARDKTP